MKTKFRAAHAKGMAALERRDYATVGQAITEESKLIREQRAIIVEGQKSVAATSRAIADATRHQAKKAKKR